MNGHIETSRVAWLSARLSTHTHRIMSLLGRLGDIGVMQKLKPALFHKFLNLMGQIAAEKDKEANVISEIEAIERKHRTFRKEGRLHHLDSKSKELQAYDGDKDNVLTQDEHDQYLMRSDLTTGNEDQSTKRSDYCWLWFLAFWFQTAANKNENQNDQLVVNSTLRDTQNPSNNRNNRSWLWLLAFWYLLSRRNISDKNHRLTPD